MNACVCHMSAPLEALVFSSAYMSQHHYIIAHLVTLPPTNNRSRVLSISSRYLEPEGGGDAINRVEIPRVPIRLQGGTNVMCKEDASASNVDIDQGGGFEASVQRALRTTRAAGPFSTIPNGARSRCGRPTRSRASPVLLRALTLERARRV